MSSKFSPRRLFLIVVFFVLPVVVWKTGLISEAGKLPASLLVPAISATKTDSLFTDADGDGRADPGDVLQYTVTVNNTGTDASNVVFQDVLESNLTLVGGSVNASPVVVNETFAVTGNVRIQVPDGASDLLGNDIDPDTGNNTGLTASGGTTSAQGGNVMINANGSFSYNPPAGFVGTDTFTYTVTDAGGVTGTGTATLTVSGMVWFINNNAAACTTLSAGCGRLTNPFSTLAAFQALNSGAAPNPQDNQNIFIYESATAYSAVLILRNGQKLIGQDSTNTLAQITGITPPSFSDAFPNMNTSAPAVTIQSTAAAGAIAINLGSGNTLRGFTVGTATDTAIRGSIFGTLTVGPAPGGTADVTINTTGRALSLSDGDFANTVGFTSVTSTGGTNNILISNVTGTVALGGGASSGASGTAFAVSGGTATITYSGTISKTSAGQIVNIGTHTTGNITLSGNLTCSTSCTGINVSSNTSGTIVFSGGTKTLNTGTTTAVTLASNSGATINFSNGGLDIDTTTATAFNATGGGTISVTTGANPNTINSTTGTALNVANTTVGANDLNFQSIAKTGGTNGIVLNNTGSSGGLTVTGTGTTAGSGGTIQNTTSHGASFTSASNISLANMNFTNDATTQTVAGSATTCGGDLRSGNNLGCVAGIYLQTVTDVALTRVSVTGSSQVGINGNNVTTFAMSNSTVTGNGNEAFESGVIFQNLFGTSSITNTIIKNNAARQLHIANTTNSSTLTLGITGTRTNNAYPTMDTGTTVIGNDALGGANTQQAILFETNTTGTNINMTLNVNGVVFNNNLPANAIDLQPIAASAVLGGTMQNSSFDTNAGGVIISAQNGSGGTYNLLNNEFNRTALQSILYAAANPTTGTLQGTIQGNTIGTASGLGSACVMANGMAGAANCTGIDVNFIGGSGGITTLIQNNTIQQFDGTGIRVRANGTGSPDVNATITGNTIQNPLNSDATGISTSMGTTSGANVDGCLGMTSNTITGTYQDPGVGAQLGIVTNVRFLSHHRLPGYSGSTTAAGGPGSAVTDYIIANNSAGTKVFTQRGGSGDYPGGGACTAPSFAPFAEASINSDFDKDSSFLNSTYQTSSEMLATLEPFIKYSARAEIASPEIAQAEAMAKSVEPATIGEADKTETPAVDLKTVSALIAEAFDRLGAAISPTVMAQASRGKKTTSEIKPNALLAGETICVDGNVDPPPCNATGFNLPAGKSVTITFRATIANVAGLAQVSNQGTVTGRDASTGTAFTPVQTDDPDVAGLTQATVTVLDRTTVTVASNANPSVFGQNVTFTATMTGVPSRASDPPGTVQFKADGNNIGAPVAVVVGTAGDNVSTAQASIASLSVGSRVITAEYSGGGAGANAYNAGTGTLSSNQVVNKANTSSAVVSSQNPLLAGQSLTLTATVNVTAPGAGTPTGTVQFLDGGTPITGCEAIALAGGAAQCTPTLAVGSHTITTSYGGDGNFNAGSGNLTSNPQVVTNTATWDGSASADWNAPANWNVNAVPGATHNADIPTGALPNQPAIPSGNLSVTNLTINAGRTLDLTGGSLTVTGALAMSGGNVTVGAANLLTIGGAGSINRTSGSILGSVEKIFAAPGAFTYPVGTATGYSPAAVNITALGTTPSNLRISANDGTAPAAPALNDATTLDRYWRLTETGDLTANVVFNYLQADVDGSENNYKVIRVAGGSAISTPNGTPCPGAGSPCVDPTANTITFNGLQNFSDWTAGELAAPTAASVPVGGRILDVNGRGISNAQIALTDAAGSVRLARTNPFGYYRFADVPTGATYVVVVRHKRYEFAPQVVSILEESSDLNFNAVP